ncbi:CD209 antigen-like protein E isoform X3, partial [Leptotrombidium deliense]
MYFKLLFFVYLVSYINPSNTVDFSLGTCPGGWSRIKEKCIYIGEPKGKFDDNSNVCQSFGGDMIKIVSEVDYDDMANLLSSGTEIYVGAKRFTLGKEQYFWKDGSEVKNKKWAKGQPNDLWKPSADCLTLYSNGYLYDRDCDESFLTACEKNLLSDASRRITSLEGSELKLNHKVGQINEKVNNLANKINLVNGKLEKLMKRFGNDEVVEQRIVGNIIENNFTQNNNIKCLDVDCHNSSDTYEIALNTDELSSIANQDENLDEFVIVDKQFINRSNEIYSAEST